LIHHPLGYGKRTRREEEECLVEGGGKEIKFRYSSWCRQKGEGFRNKVENEGPLREVNKGRKSIDWLR